VELGRTQLRERRAEVPLKVAPAVAPVRPRCGTDKVLVPDLDVRERERCRVAQRRAPRGGRARRRVADRELDLRDRLVDVGLQRGFGDGLAGEGVPCAKVLVIM
jgi:hypothetical protein